MMHSFPISIESAARMTPSTVLRTFPRKRKIDCRCCNQRRQWPGTIVHPRLGPLCWLCSFAFDRDHDAYGLGAKPPVCPLCFEGDCPLHDQV